MPNSRRYPPALRALALALFALLATPARPAHAGPHSYIFVRSGVGFAAQSLDDWNGARDIDSLGMRTATFGATRAVDLVVGYHAKAPLSFALGTSNQYRTLDARGAGVATPAAWHDETLLQLRTLYLSVAYWPQAQNDAGFYLSQQVGFTFGRAEFAAAYTNADTTATLNSFLTTGKWTRTWLMLGLAAGYESHARDNMLYFAEVGWRWQDMGVMSGRQAITADGVAGAAPHELRDGARAIGTNFSGVRAIAGLGFWFRQH